MLSTISWIKSCAFVGRRSQSVVRGSRSMSVARGESSSSLTQAMAGVCPHKRHSRLENLRTLVLSGNYLEQIILTLDSNSGRRAEEAEIKRTSSRKSTTETASLSSSPSIESPLSAGEVRVFSCLAFCSIFEFSESSSENDISLCLYVGS